MGTSKSEREAVALLRAIVDEHGPACECAADRAAAWLDTYDNRPVPPTAEQKRQAAHNRRMVRVTASALVADPTLGNARAYVLARSRDGRPLDVKPHPGAVRAILLAAGEDAVATTIV